MKKKEEAGKQSPRPWGPVIRRRGFLRRKLRWLKERVLRMRVSVVRRRAFGLLMLSLFIGEAYWIDSTWEPPESLQHYFSIRPPMHPSPDGRPQLENVIAKGWDSIIAELSIKKKWDSLMRARPDLLDSLAGMNAAEMGRRQ